MYLTPHKTLYSVTRRSYTSLCILLCTSQKAVRQSFTIYLTPSHIAGRGNTKPQALFNQSIRRQPKDLISTTENYDNGNNDKNNDNNCNAKHNGYKFYEG